MGQHIKIMDLNTISQWRTWQSAGYHHQPTFVVVGGFIKYKAEKQLLGHIKDFNANYKRSQKNIYYNNYI